MASQLFFCVQLFYAWVGPAIKMSFLLLYRRVFIVQWFMRITVAVAALVIIWCISVTFTVIFECQPVGSYWQPLLQQHCIDSRVLLELFKLYARDFEHVPLASLLYRLCDGV